MGGNRKARDRRDGRKKNASARPPSAGAERATTPTPVRARWPRARVALVALATAYLVTVWFDGVGSTWPAKLLPRPWLYFSQIAALFKHAGIKAIDYRAEGWDCAEGRWKEIDVRPFFRIDRDHKENRFHRALQFYRRERLVMRALDEYVVERHNQTREETIGGVRFLSLRLPYPAPGERITPYERKPLDSYGPEVRREWYWTPRSRRAVRCGAPPKDRAPKRAGDGPPLSSWRDTDEDGDGSGAASSAPANAEKEDEVDP